MPLETNHSSICSLGEAALGRAVCFGYGCSYRLALTVCVVMMGCNTSNPSAVWPRSSHTLTLCSAQQQGCENTKPDICFPPVEWNVAGSWAKCSYGVWAWSRPHFGRKTKLSLVVASLLDHGNHFVLIFCLPTCCGIELIMPIVCLWKCHKLVENGHDILKPKDFSVHRNIRQFQTIVFLID